MIERSPWVREVSLDNIAHAFSDDVFEGHGDEYYRPLQTLQNMADFQIWGLTGNGYRLTNLAYHTASACLLLILLRRLFDGGDGSARDGALLRGPSDRDRAVADHRGARGDHGADLHAGGAGRGDAGGRPGSIRCRSCSTPWPASARRAASFSRSSPCWSAGVRRASASPWPWYAGYGIVAAGYLTLRSFAVSSGFLGQIAEVGPLLVLRDLPRLLVEYLRIVILPIDLHSHRQDARLRRSLSLRIRPPRPAPLRALEVAEPAGALRRRLVPRRLRAEAAADPAPATAPAPEPPRPLGPTPPRSASSSFSPPASRG